MIRKFTLSLFFSLTFLALLSSCKKFEGGQSVPSYIRIDSIGLVCDYSTYGAHTCNFVDAWVYLDGNPLGCFELPSTFPVLKEGPHTVAVYPGIARDGIKSLRTPYPFTAPAEYVDLNLVKDSIVRLEPVVQYYPNGDNLHVRWKEDFDKGTVTIQPTSQSNVGIVAVDGPLAWHDAEGHSLKSGKVTLTSDTLAFCIANQEEFRDLPTTGTACMLEMDYKCSDTIDVGLFYVDGAVKQTSILRLRPTGASGVEPTEWKKIYINIGPYLVDYKDSEYFKIYISSWYVRNDGPQYFYFDNLKLIYLDIYQ